MRRFFHGVVACCALGCAALFSQVFCVNCVASEVSALRETAEKRVKDIYPKFISLVQAGVQEDDMLQFAGEHMDAVSISKRFCGAENDALFKSIVKFLTWRLKTEAIQSVRSYQLHDNMQSVVKKTGVEVKCVLKGQSDEVQMTVVFSKKATSLGGIREIILLGIPLIEGAKVPIKAYFEKNGLKMKSMKPKERAEKMCTALDEFIKQNARGSK